MKIINFPIINSEDKNFGLMGCYTGMLISYAKWKSEKFDFLLCDSWDFKFLRNPDYPKTLSNNIGVSDLNISDNLKNIFGAVIEEKAFEEKNLIDFIKFEVDNDFPVIIKGDVYWCPWSIHFKKIHAPHSFFIIGYDDKDNFICSDYAPRNIEVNLLKEDLMKGIKGCYKIRLKNRNEDIDVNILFDKALSNLKKRNPTQKLSDFVVFMEEEFDLKQQIELFNGEILNMPVVWNLLEIGGARVLFSRFLKRYIMETGRRELSSIAEQIFSFNKMWTIEQRFFSKALFGKDKEFLDKAIIKLKEIEVKEKEIWILHIKNYHI